MSHAAHVQKRQEKFFKLAKDQGYRSRAAFKLIQLNKKYNFLGKSKACIDLCAAPGGWLQIAQKYMPVNSMIIGVDILPIKPLPNVTTFIEDITTPACRQQLKKILHGWQVDLVLHDGAPSVGGGASWVKDSYLQTELVLHSLKLATEFLVKGGTFVTKIFRSNDYMSLTWVLKQFFEKVEVTKPVASRAASSEVFAVCQGYLAPQKIDPRMFNPAIVFQQTLTDTSENKVLNVLNAKVTKKPNRSGYDDDAGAILSKKCSVATYVETPNPSDILAVYNEMYFDEASDIYKQHASTTSEIEELITDLKVLGKGDFSQLIKWHKKLNMFKKQLKEAELEAQMELIANADMDDGEETHIEIDADEIQAQEIEELNKKLERKARLDQKKKHGAKMKEIKRLALNAHNLMEKNTAQEEGMFTLTEAKDDSIIKALKSDKIIDIIGREKFLEIISTNVDEPDFSDVEEDAEEELSYEELRERSIDNLWNQYKTRKNIVTKVDTKRAKQMADAQTEKFVNDEDSEEDDTEDEMDALDRARKQAKSTKSNVSLLNQDKDDDTAIAEKWFSQGVFADIDIDDEQERNHRKQIESKLNTKVVESRKRKYESDDDDAEEADSELDSDDDSDSDSEPEDNGRWLGTNEEKLADKAKRDKIREKAMTYAEKYQGVGGGSGFEEVAALSDYTDDSDARAEILALGTKMLRKKNRNAIIDAGYNKYVFDDIDDLPEWFVQDEANHSRPQMPISKAEVDVMKQYLKAIDARPIKKLAEAQGRKKKAAMRKLERAKIQANSIIGQEGVSQEEKLKQIEKLYRTQRAKLKQTPNKIYSVSSRSGRTNSIDKNKKGSGEKITVRVDRRMKADKIGKKRAEFRKEKQAKNKRRKRDGNK